MPTFRNLMSLNLARDLRAFLSIEAGFGRGARANIERLPRDAVGTRDGDGYPRRMTLPPQPAAAIEESRRKLLDKIVEVSGGGELTFVHSYGNRGDDLIYAGARQLLAGVRYEEISARKKLREAGGHTAIMSGGGDWCNAFHSFDPKVFQALERRFEKVILLPTTFDPSVPLVRRILKRTDAFVFARERESYRVRGR